MNFYLETIEIRIDDHILDTVITYFNQAMDIITFKSEKNANGAIDS
jgi:hypothetical protein